MEPPGSAPQALASLQPEVHFVSLFCQACEVAKAHRSVDSRSRSRRRYCDPTSNYNHPETLRLRDEIQAQGLQILETPNKIAQGKYALQFLGAQLHGQRKMQQDLNKRLGRRIQALDQKADQGTTSHDTHISNAPPSSCQSPRFQPSSERGGRSLEQFGRRSPQAFHWILGNYNA